MLITGTESLIADNISILRYTKSLIFFKFPLYSIITSNNNHTQFPML